MATSAEMGTSNPRVKYTITITENSTNAAANTSNVTVSARAYRTNTGYETYGTGTFYCTIDGKSYTAPISPNQKITNAGIILFSKTLDIQHNSDGSKHLETKSRINIDTVLYSQEWGFGAPLTTLPRATTPLLSPDTQELGGRIDISLPRASNSFTHSVRYTFGSASGIIANNAETSAYFVLPTSLASQFPNSNSGWGEVIVDTYNNGSFVGTAKARFTAMLPGTLRPIVNRVTVRDSDDSIQSTFGAPIQNRSRLRVEIEASGQQGSAIQSITSVLDGLSYTGNSFESAVVTKSGEIPLEITVTDSRGQITTYTERVTVFPYEPPKIVTFSVVRGNQYGQEDESGTHALVNLNYVISELNRKNAKTCKIEYKRNTDQSWSVLATKNEYSYSGKFSAGDVLDAEYYYSFRLTLTDYFGSVISDGNGVSDDFTLVNWNTSGKGIAVGKVSEKDALEIAMETEITKDVTFKEGASLHIDSIVSDGNNLIEALKNLSAAKEYDSGTVKGPYTSTNSANNIRVELKRRGCLVACKITMLAQFSKSGSFGAFDEVRIPIGYRPVLDIRTPYNEVSGSSIFGTGRYLIGKDGGITIYVNNPSWTERHLSITWITDD